MVYKVSNIVYDTTDSMGCVEGITLPTTLEVCCDSEEEIADAISDMTNFLVESFVIE